MLKVYIALDDFSLSTSVEVEGVKQRIHFRGGTMTPKRNGTFTTSDEKWQQAIEGSPMFGHTVGIDKVFGEPKPVKKAVEEPELAEKVCATVNEAAEWLVGLGCIRSHVSGSDKAVAKARELGFALRFERE